VSADAPRHEPLLRVVDLSVAYGPIPALASVSLEVQRGEVVVLAGSNGAGKTTLLKAVSGLLPPVCGEVVFGGRRVTGWAAHRVARSGIRYVPEGRHVWPRLSVADHLALAWRALPAARRRDIAAFVVDLFPRLGERWHQLAGSLSGGEQQMLAIARGLAADPALLMIDELSLGLAPRVIHQIYDALARVRRAGLTLLIVEQALPHALALADRGYVLEQGRIVVSGTAETLRASEAVRKAYLGL
jgi:branched-chain amino acid transport system ATP-binding protein